MSNGRPFRRRHTSGLDAFVTQTEREPVPGGCPHCDAYQTMTNPAEGVYLLEVAHDDWCPTLRAMSAGAN